MVDGYTFHLIVRENRDPIFLMLRSLTPKERSRIPSFLNVSLQELCQEIAPYVVDWNLQAEQIGTGELHDIPAPGSQAATKAMGAGNEWKLLEMVDDTAVIWACTCLRRPDYVERYSFRE